MKADGGVLLVERAAGGKLTASSAERQKVVVTFSYSRQLALSHAISPGPPDFRLGLPAHHAAQADVVAGHGRDVLRVLDDVGFD